MAVGAADLDGGLGTAARMGQPQRRAVGQVASTPLEHCPHHRHEILACLGEHGLSTDERIRTGATVEHLAGLKPAFFNEAYAARFPADRVGDRGARIMATFVNALEQRGGHYRLQTTRESGGMANAAIFERLYGFHAFCSSKSGMTRDVFDW